MITFVGPEGLDTVELQQILMAEAVHEKRPGSYLATTTDPLTSAARLDGWRRDKNIDVADFRVSSATLEDVFLKLTGTAVRD